MDSLDEYESLTGARSVGGNEDRTDTAISAEPINFRNEVRPQAALQVKSSHELDRYESVQTDAETQCGTIGREVILVVDADGFGKTAQGQVNNDLMWRSIIGAVAGQSGSPVAAFVVMGLSCALPPNVVDFFEGLGAQVLPEDPPPGTDTRDYTDIRIGLHLETQGQKAALKKGDGSRPIYWVATHDGKGGVALMFRGVNPEKVDRGFVLRVTESSVHGAPPDTRLLQAIRQEESRSGRKIEVVDQSLLEAIASGQVAEMQRLLLEGKEDEAVKLGPPREKRRREASFFEIKGEERAIALAVQRSLQSLHQEPEPVQTSAEDDVEECAAAKRLRVAGAHPTRAEDKRGVVGLVLDEESMKLNIKEYIQETRESVGAIDEKDVKASDSTGDSTGGAAQCDDSEDDFSYQYSDTNSCHDEEEEEEEEELSVE